MNRRNFFSVVAGLVASLCLPKLGRAITTAAPADVIGELPPPVWYVGDADDPCYYRSDQRMSRHKGLSCFVDGVDRSHEAYECYVGENGWANLFLIEEELDGARTIQRADGHNGRYSIRGRVEFVPDAKSSVQGIPFYRPNQSVAVTALRYGPLPR